MRIVELTADPVRSEEPPPVVRSEGLDRVPLVGGQPLDLAHQVLNWHHVLQRADEVAFLHFAQIEEHLLHLFQVKWTAVAAVDETDNLVVGVLVTGIHEVLHLFQSELARVLHVGHHLGHLLLAQAVQHVSQLLQQVGPVLLMTLLLSPCNTTHPCHFKTS